MSYHYVGHKYSTRGLAWVLAQRCAVAHGALVAPGGILWASVPVAVILSYRHTDSQVSSATNNAPCATAHISKLKPNLSYFEPLFLYYVIIDTIVLVKLFTILIKRDNYFSDLLMQTSLFDYISLIENRFKVL